MSDTCSTALELRRHTSMTGARFDEVLAAHDAQVRADEREKIAVAIESKIAHIPYDLARSADAMRGVAWARSWSTNIARSGGAS